MDHEVVIDVNNISKSYKLYDAPSDRLKETLHPFGKKYHKDFFALKDVNFQVRKGETVGIIGKNGAGKSTLLKIITGVLTPSDGMVVVNGKVASLLELGAGFNPEFTGIENVYLNGTIMGYTKKEMDERLPEILAFADIGDFAYQPVKTYSSGMYVRLAFSVAINVEPEVLIVDEALSVGDAKFQRKCFSRLETLKARGTTILFVTHDMATIKHMCSKAILINSGNVVRVGDPKDVIIEYWELLFPKIEEGNEQRSIVDNVPSKNDAVFNGLTIRPDNSKANSFGIGGANIEQVLISNIKEGRALHGGEEVNVEIIVSYEEQILERIANEEGVEDNLIVGFPLSDVKGTYIFGMTTYDKNIRLVPGERNKQESRVCFKFIMPYLQSGDYFFNCAIALGTQENHVQLKWYDGLVVIKVQSAKRYVYGLMYQEYQAKLGQDKEYA